MMSSYRYARVTSHLMCKPNWFNHDNVATRTHKKNNNNRQNLAPANALAPFFSSKSKTE